MFKKIVENFEVEKSRDFTSKLSPCDLLYFILSMFTTREKEFTGIKTLK